MLENKEYFDVNWLFYSESIIDFVGRILACQLSFLSFVHKINKFRDESNLINLRALCMIWTSLSLLHIFHQIRHNVFSTRAIQLTCNYLRQFLEPIVKFIDWLALEHLLLLALDAWLQSRHLGIKFAFSLANFAHRLPVLLLVELLLIKRNLSDALLDVELVAFGLAASLVQFFIRFAKLLHFSL